jgi:hypothetical protein
MIEDKISHLIDHKIDISPYFLNPMTHWRLNNRYPKIISDSDELMIPINFPEYKGAAYFDNEEHSPDFISNYLQEKSKTLMPCCTRKQNDDEDLVDSEYILICMPQLSSEHPRQFAITLKNAAERDINILSSLVAQILINYKWNTYTRSYSFRRLCLGCLFIALYFADIYLCFREDYDAFDGKTMGLRIATLCLLYFNFRYEIIQMVSLGLFAYLGDNFWNLFDVLLTLTYSTYFTLTFIYNEAKSDIIVSI